MGLSRDESMSSIARRIGRSPSTVTREVAANGGVANYGAWRAHCRARKESRRPRLGKLSHPPLNELVTQWLEELWSPEEIAQRLRLQFPDDSIMQVSHETIYQSLFVQGRGELRRELTRCLRSGRTRRRSQGRAPNSGQIPDMVMISERRAEVADRAVPGIGRVTSSWVPTTARPLGPSLNDRPGLFFSCIFLTARVPVMSRWP